MESLLMKARTCLTAPDGNGPSEPWHIVLDVEIALRFAKVRHDLFIRPFIIAESRPGVEILGEPALHGLTVDRRAAADHFALGDVDRALLLGDGTAQGPVVS
jgi:hypothetical protein